MFEFLLAYSDDLVQSFTDPRKRLFWGYLLCALLIALLYCLVVRKYSMGESVGRLFAKDIWWSRSSRADYQLVLINQLVMKLISPALISQLVIATFLFHSLYELFPSRPIHLEVWPDWSIAVLFTICFFVLDDFARFFVHRLMHKLPVLWAFHQVHHSAETLTPLTVLRTHPVEAIVFSIRSALTQAFAIAIFIFFLGERADLVTILGANIVVFFFNALGANLRHSHVHIQYWPWIEKVLISPAQHQIHHSVEERHWDKNFGVALSLWDRLFGSLHHSESKPPIGFGLSDHQLHSLRHLYWQPIKECAALIHSTIIKRYDSIRSIVASTYRKTNYEVSKKSV